MDEGGDESLQVLVAVPDFCFQILQNDQRVIKYSCSCCTEATAQTPYITGKNYCAVNRGLFGNGEARLRDGFGEWIVSESKSKGLEVLASCNPCIAAIFFLFLKVCGRCYRLTYKGNHEQGLGRAFLAKLRTQGAVVSSHLKLEMQYRFKFQLKDASNSHFELIWRVMLSQNW